MMDNDVLDVLCELGCFSARSPEPDLVDETTGDGAGAEELAVLDDPWIELGGEG
jgi:hypothetical protein